MPPTLETWEFQKHRTKTVKSKLFFKDENNVADMNGIEPFVSSSTSREKSGQHATHSSCVGDHVENVQGQSIPFPEQFSCSSSLSLIDQWSPRTEVFPGVCYLDTSPKKTGCVERRDVDRNKRTAAGGLHRRQGSGDLYMKLEPFDSGEFNISKEHDNSDFSSSRYVVTADGSNDPESAESTSLTKALAVNPKFIYSDDESLPSGVVFVKEGITVNASTGGVGGVFGLKEWYKNRMLVLKATSKVEGPTKSKYLRKLVLSSWKHNGAGGTAIFNILGKRPLQSSPVIALKALIIIHKLMQQGPTDCSAACYSHLQILIDIRTTFQNLDDNAVEPFPYGPLICYYASMLLEKATFHHRFQAYQKNYSVDLGAVKDKPSCSGQTIIDPLRPEALVCLQGLQDVIVHTLEEGFAFLRKRYTTGGAKLSAGSKNGTPCAVAGPGLSTICGDIDSLQLVISVLIPVLREADLVYDICYFLLTTQLSRWREGKYGQDITGLNEMASKFDHQHKALRNFFEEAGSINAISCNVTSPNPADDAGNKYLRSLPWKDNVAYKGQDSARHHPQAELDYLAQLESARPKSVPTEGTKNLEVVDDFIVREIDPSWMSEHVGGKAFSRQDVTGPVLGGVGAAAAAAIQRFAASQAEAKRAATASGATELSMTASTGLRNIRLEPPPLGYASNSFHMELGKIARPGKPQHTRGTGRKWSSFDDEAFLHQQLVENSWSPISRLVSPTFYSPRAPGSSNHDVQGVLSPVHIDSTSPLLLGFVSAPSLTNKPIDPFIGSPISAIPTMEFISAANLAIRPPCAGHPSEFQLPEPQAQPRYTRVEPPPLIELETVVEERSTVGETQGTDRLPSPLQPDHQRNELPASWQVAGFMSDVAAWYGPQVVGDVGGHSRKTSLSDIPFAADWEIPVCELKLGPKIGQGAFGDVLRGTWQATDVAVKRLQNNSNYAQAIVAIRHEVAVIMRLRHPNIILFMGACTLPPDICIVMEFAANGSLYGVLHNPNIGIDMTTVTRWASEAARGMNYLHTRNPPIVHRDLKSVNLLVDGDWHIKVSDFGLAMTKQSSYAYTQVGTWGWMAPEVLESAPYDEKADVYSFGIVLWELITREEPFRGYHPMQIMRAIDRGDRPAIPESCPHTYKQLVEDCWQKDPSGRPMFEEILARLGAMSVNLFEIQR